MFNPKEIKLFFKRLDNLVHVCSLIFMGLSMLVTLLPIVAWLCKVSITYSYFTLVSTCLFYATLLLFPVSSLLDGPTKEKKMVLIEFIPNMLANIIGIFVYFYANIVGLIHCKNQSVWKKTMHKVTEMHESQLVSQSAGVETEATPVVNEEITEAVSEAVEEKQPETV
jgi:hypothetical protein